MPVKVHADLERVLRKRILRKYNRLRHDSKTVYYTRMVDSPDLGLQT